VSRAGEWIGKLEAEVGRELGQRVALAPGGDAPELGGRLTDTMSLPGVRLVVAAEAEGLARLLVEARVIEPGQAATETVRELWSGILASVAAGLGGQASPGGTVTADGEPCVLRLGSVTLRLALGVAADDPSPAERTSQEGKCAVPAPPPVSGSEPRPGNFDLLLEVELDASVRFGSREMELKDLLELGPGDVVELDRQLADPVDLVVGDRIVARGEVVLVNGNFGLRVTEVSEPMRRLESIRCLW